MSHHVSWGSTRDSGPSAVVLGPDGGIVSGVVVGVGSGLIPGEGPGLITGERHELNTRTNTSNAIMVESFTEKETKLILHGTSPNQLPQATAEKLKRLCLLYQLDVFPRNLDVLFERGSS